MRSLIVAPDTLADAVMAQPLAALIRRFDPDGRIDVVADPSVAPVFRAMAEVSEVLDGPSTTGRLRPWSAVRLARRLDRLRHDRAFVLPGARRAALAPWLARIPVRIGLDGDTRWGLINQPYGTASGGGSHAGRPLVERFAHLAFDASQPLPGHVPNPVLARDPAREAAARARAGLSSDSRLLAMCVGSEDGPSRRWPPRHWASLLATVAQSWPSMHPVLLGGPQDREFATEVATLSGGVPKNLCGRLSLTDTLACIAQSEAVVAHDCALMHVAAAYSRPMVAVFGPTDPRFSPPRSSRAKVEWLHADCGGCTRPVCVTSHGECTTAIRPESVFASLYTVTRLGAGHLR